MGLFKNKLYVMLASLVALTFIGLMTLTSATDVSAKTIELNTANYSYGKYKITARGVGYDGVYDEDSVVYYYLPVYARIEEDENGDKYLKLDYDTSDDSGEGGEGGEGEDVSGLKVAKIEIKITDENGKVIPGVPPITVTPPTTEVPISGYFDQYDLPSGSYKIEITAYNKNNEALYEPYIVRIKYDAEEDILVPDTGSFFQGLNISKIDYLVTGLIAFATVAIPGIFIVARKNDKTNKKSKKH